MYSTRTPGEGDIPELRELIDAQESALDPLHKPASISWPTDLIRGYVDEPHNRVWCAEQGTIAAWASVQVDTHRQRLEIEMFRQPQFPELAQVWDWCRSIADSEHPGWDVWPAISSRDGEAARILEATDFTILRRYFFLTRPLTDDAYPELPADVTIEVMRTAEDFHEWHAAHQDAFSRHFGFMPRPADVWIDHYLKSDAADPDGRFLLRVNGVVAGFVVCSNENVHLNGGFVDLLGVRHDYQRRGLGELLLHWAIAYSANRGFSDIGLSVDTGNQSGALALYERVAFTKLSEFHVYARR